MTPFDLQEVDLTTNLNDYYRKIYLYPYARYAFLEILKLTNISSIYIPAFICRDMLAPINAMGVEYFFYDVDESLFPKLKDIKCDAILMVNYFGFEQKMEPFVEYKKKYNAIIIEDNAHGLFSKSKDGKLLGTRGDFGLLSLRKTIFLPNGAALLVNNVGEFKIENEDIILNSQFTYDDEKYKKKLLLKRFFFHKYIGVSFLLFRRFIRFLKTGSAFPIPNKEDEFVLPSNDKLTPMLKENKININIEDEINRRVTMFKRIQKWAKKFCIEPIYELYEGVVPFGFAFIDNGRYKEFERYLFTKGFFILPWPDLPDEIVNECPNFYKKIKVVPFLW